MYSANVVLLGASAVGKSTLIHRYLGDSFSENYDATVGIKAFIEATEISGYDVLLTLLDIPFGEEFHLEGTDIVVLVFSLTDIKSFKEVQTILQDINGKGVPIILVGNKRDLVGERQISDDDMSGIYVPIIEVSAKSDADISILFELIGTELIKSQQSWWGCLRCRFCNHCGRCYCCP